MDFDITEKAKQELSNYMKKNLPVKIALTNYSCCGVKLSIIPEKKHTGDEIYRIDEMEIIVSEELSGMMKSFEIDYDADGFIVSGTLLN